VNGHIESTYSVKTGKWTAPEFVESPFLRIHGMAPALNYGQQCYEGLKAYRSPDDKTINVFRPQSNAERMQHSASAISIPHVPIEHFKQCVQLAVSLNAEFVPPHRTGSAMYVRPLLFGSSAQLGLSPPEEYTFVVFVMPTGVYHGVHPVDALILEDFDRAAPNGTGSAKVGGNYAPVLRFSDKARSEGFGITLHLDSATRSEVDEFSTSGFIGISGTPDNSITVVVPDSKNVIKSVTSDSVCEIAKSLGWKVECRPVSFEPIKLPTETIKLNPHFNTRSNTKKSPPSTKSWPPAPPPLSSRSRASPCALATTSSLSRTAATSPAPLASSSWSSFRASSAVSLRTSSAGAMRSSSTLPERITRPRAALRASMGLVMRRLSVSFLEVSV
jgi:branched-chain amino acid aminotransferase